MERFKPPCLQLRRGCQYAQARYDPVYVAIQYVCDVAGNINALSLNHPAFGIRVQKSENQPKQYQGRDDDQNERGQPSRDRALAR